MTANHDQFLRLFLASQEDLRAFLATAVRDWTRADDLLQDTALALWRSFDRYDPARPFGPWARGVATHLLYKEWDRSRRGPRAVDPQTMLALVDAFDRNEEPEPAHNVRRHALSTCLARLDARVRELLDLRYQHNLGPEAIAARTSMGPSAVKKALTRAKARLADCIERRLQAQEPVDAV